MHINDNDDFNIYVLAELNYKNKYPNFENPFPVDWYSIQDYKYKTQIILEALNNNKTIEETELYQNRFNNSTFIK